MNSASTPIALYLDLAPDRHPDIETVARAMIEFKSGLKEITDILDPNVVVSVGLVKTDEGSLSIQALITFVKRNSKKYTDKRTIAGVVIATGFWFGAGVAEYIVENALDAAGVGEAIENVVKDMGLASDDENTEQEEISEEQIQRIIEKTLELIEKRDRAPTPQRTFRILQRDDAVIGAGIRLSSDPAGPVTIVPRSEFARRSGAGEDIHIESDTKRVSHSEEWVYLISPVLVQEKRRWKFSGSRGEFGAYVKDEEFLSKLLRGDFHLEMVTGIKMYVQMETVEKREDGVWNVQETTIIKILDCQPPAEQSEINY
ncbi:MAG: hypothetical protein RIB45_09380 [Marivibrio sp.]|uniref:hypothetical protein n=1 Tax=Marivibrio sp. TaxID=2039719 RepID=UPI0032ECEE31